MKAVRIWLFVLCAITAAIVLIGGATRLTQSGLSITEWRPITGAIPPLSSGQWQEAFHKYRQIPQYQALNPGMGLDEFKTIYWWEWAHRNAARLLAVAFAIPFVIFLRRRLLSPPLARRLGLVFLLGAAQGLLGWWMVKSGLADRVEVSHYRLAAHLGLALIIYAMLLLPGLDPRRRTATPDVAAWGLLIFVFVQIMSGAFVSGLNAGKIYTEWPLWNGSWIPSEAVFSADDPAFVQFVHRTGAWMLALAALANLRRFAAAPAALRNSARVFALAVFMQIALGILALVHAAPTTLALLHQAGMLALWTAALVHFFLCGRPGQQGAQIRPGQAFR